MRHMADYSQKEKELEREHLEKLVKEEDRSIKPMKEFESPEDDHATDRFLRIIYTFFC